MPDSLLGAGLSGMKYHSVLYAHQRSECLQSKGHEACDRERVGRCCLTPTGDGCNLEKKKEEEEEGLVRMWRN